MTAPDPALLAALAAAPRIEPDPSQVGKVGVFLLPIEAVDNDDSPWRVGGETLTTFSGSWLRSGTLVAVIDPPEPRDAEIARLRARVAELEART